MRPRRCQIHNQGEPRCTGAYYATLKVRVFHPDTFQKAWQQWHFCEAHFNKFMAAGGEGWFRWYPGEMRADAPVIGYKIICSFM